MPPAQPAAKGGQTNSLNRLQGKWVPISGHYRAKPFSAAQLANMSFTFDGNRAEMVDADGKRHGKGTFKIDAKRKPMLIDLIAPDGKEGLPGIFEFDGDRLKLAFIDEDYARPTDFAPSKQPDHMTLIYQRVPVQGDLLKPDEQKALKAAEAFLAALDKGRFGELHGLLARFAKRKTPRGKLSQSMQSVRDTFGKATSRTLQRMQLLSEFPGLPKGRYAGVQYKSNYERKNGLWESLLLNVDPDGVWRVNTYANTLEPLPFPEVKD